MNRATSAICTLRFMYQVCETLGSPRVLNSLPRLHQQNSKEIFTLKSGTWGTIIIKTKEWQNLTPFWNKGHYRNQKIKFSKGKRIDLTRYLLLTLISFLSLRYPCPEELTTDALEESKTGTTESLFRFNCACVKCSCLPFWPRAVLEGIFLKITLHSHILSKSVLLYVTFNWSI